MILFVVPHAVPKQNHSPQARRMKGSLHALQHLVLPKTYLPNFPQEMCFHQTNSSCGALQENHSLLSGKEDLEAHQIQAGGCPFLLQCQRLCKWICKCGRPAAQNCNCILIRSILHINTQPSFLMATQRHLQGFISRYIPDNYGKIVLLSFGSIHPITPREMQSLRAVSMGILAEQKQRM